MVVEILLFLILIAVLMCSDAGKIILMYPVYGLVIVIGICAIIGIGWLIYLYPEQASSAFGILLMLGILVAYIATEKRKKAQGVYPYDQEENEN